MSYKGPVGTLNTGAKIPLLGFGTWQDKESQEGAVLEALKAGYRHIDTARVYGTEPAVGEAIKKSGIPREEIFLTTKLWNNAHHPDDVEKALDASLKDLGTDYVDLYLMHWPSPFARSDSLFPKDADGTNSKGDTDFVDTYRALEKLPKSKARAIGVSNFSQNELDRLLSSTSTPPAAHQIELHPYLPQHSFHAYHVDKGIHITQYSPFGNSNPIYDKGADLPHQLIADPVILEIAKKHNATGAQVTLAWGIAKGHSVIPKSKTPERIQSNFSANDVKLDAEDIKKIDGLDKKLRLNDASESFKYNFFVGLDGKK